MRDANHQSEDGGYTGFAAAGRAGRRNAAVAELAATVVLTISTLIAATAVSIGFARADTLGGSPFATLPRTDAIALAVLLGLLFIGVSGMAAGLTAWRRRMWRNRYRYD